MKLDCSVQTLVRAKAFSVSWLASCIHILVYIVLLPVGNLYFLWMFWWLLNSNTFLYIKTCNRGIYIEYKGTDGFDTFPRETGHYSVCGGLSGNPYIEVNQSKQHSRQETFDNQEFILFIYTIWYFMLRSHKNDIKSRLIINTS